MKSQNLKAFVFGSYREKFHQILKNKLRVKIFKNLREALQDIFINIKNNKLPKNVIFFSPAGASFDNFKNFEDRGKYFNNLVKKFINAK